MAAADLETILMALLGDLPEVRVVKKKTQLSLQVGKKVFGFTKGDGVVLKVPVEIAAALIKQKSATQLKMGARVMKEWVVLRRDSPAAFKKEKKLFAQSVEFTRE